MIKPRQKNYLITFFCLFFLNLSGEILAQSIPYPEALKRAAIVQSSVAHIDTNGIITGNGDINALIYSKDDGLTLHLSKNDAWDARLITKDDLPLLDVDVPAHSWTGGGRPESWNYPYPTQSPPAVVRILSTGETVKAVTNLQRGKVSVVSQTGETIIRALAQKNVFYFETERPLRLEGFPQPFLPEPEPIQTESGIAVKQVFPGDQDYPGMEVVTVLESREGKHAVAMVTSRESMDPLEDALQLVKAILDQPPAAVIQAHEDIWEEFWAKSGIQIADSDLQNWWYRQSYYLRCLSRPGAYPVALQGGYNKKAGWHGTWTMNYNAQQTFWPAFNSNHPELAEPFIDLVNDFHPRARWYARTVFHCEGAVTPHNFWPFEPDPMECTSVNRRQLAFMPWSYGIGTAGHIGHILWLHYAYTRDTVYMKEKIYPVIKDYADFYASFIGKCREVNGKVIFGPSVDPEHTPFGWDNSPYDLAWARHTLNAAIQGATDLGIDTGRIRTWSESLLKLPWYPVSNGVVKVGERDEGYNIITPVVPVFPAEQISWFSSEHEKALFKETIRWIESRYNKNNSVVMLNVARARMSMTDEAYFDTKNWFKGKEQPNGLFYWQAHGFYMSEQTAVAGLITEFLLQSVDNIIRIFSAWPEALDAEFSGLRARGGFLVSARNENGVVQEVIIESTQGGELRFLPSWEKTDVRYADGRVKRLHPDSMGVICIKTEKGQKLEFSGP